MNVNQLRPASQLSQKFGVKAVLYGGPGTGKTPMVTTAPRPVLCAVEPGLLSMRTSNVPTWEAYTAEKIDEFFAWFFSSREAAQFDTLAVDSISQLAEIILIREKKNNRDGRAAYGKMSEAVMDILNKLYYMPQKHIVLIAKQMTADENGVAMRKPFFPGQDLNVKVPHAYDEILHVGMNTIPGVINPQRSIRTAPGYDVTARDRSGMLAEFEPPDLGALFVKAMAY
jgi:hypothetical protein